MANSEHLAILRKGVDEWNRWRKSNLEISPDLREANLRGFQLDQIILRDADLSNANLSTCSLKEADLSKAVLNEAVLMGADLSRANLYRAKLRHCNLTGADLRHTVLYQANLSNADLSRSNLSKANLRKANLSKADLSRVYFSKGKAEEAIFNEAIMEKANFYEANLVNSDLTDADLREAVFYKANLSGADFTGADLENANFNLANLQNALFNDATINGAKLTGALVSGLSIHGLQQGHSEQLAMVVLQSDGLVVRVDSLETAQQVEALLIQEGAPATHPSIEHLALVAGNFNGERKIILGRLLEEIRSQEMRVVQFECIARPEAEFRKHFSRLLRQARWLVFDASEAKHLVDELLPLLAEFPEVQVTAFVKTNLKWQVATPFAYYVDRFSLGEYERPEDIPGLLSFSRSSDSAKPRVIILEEGEKMPAQPVAREPRAERIVPDEDATVKLQPQEIMDIAGVQLEMKEDRRSGRYKNPAATRRSNKQKTATAEKPGEEPVYTVAEKPLGQQASPNPAAANGSKPVPEEPVGPAADTAEANKYEEEAADVAVGNNVIIIGQAGDAMESKKQVADQSGGNKPPKVADRAADNPFSEVLNNPGANEVTPPRRANLQFPEEGRELVPSPKTVVIIEPEAKTPVQKRSYTRLWTGLAAAAILTAALYAGWVMLHTDVQLILPKNANAHILLNGTVVALEKQEGDLNYYRAGNMMIGTSDLEIYSTQLGTISQDEFVRFKRHKAQVDISRSESGTFPIPVQFDTLYSVRKIARGKNPTINSTGTKLVYTRSEIPPVANSFQHLFIYNLTSNQEQQIAVDNRQSWKWDGERPWLGDEDQNIYIGAYRFRSGKTTPFRIDIQTGTMYRIPIPETGKLLSFVPLSSNAIAFQNNIFDSEGRFVESFTGKPPYMDKLFKVADGGLLYFTKESTRPRVMLGCNYLDRDGHSSQLFSIAANLPPYVSASRDAKTVAVTVYSGLNREFFSTIRLWAGEQFVDLIQPLVDGSREYSDGSDYHQTEATIDAGGSHLVYEYNSDIFLIDIREGVTFQDLLAAEQPVK